MLSNEQTSQLIDEAKKGSDKAKEKLIMINSPLIKRLSPLLLRRRIRPITATLPQR